MRFPLIFNTFNFFFFFFFHPDHHQPMTDAKSAEKFEPGSFNPQRHFYPRVLNATIHPLVRHFFGMTQRQIVQRYCHLHPAVSEEALVEALAYAPTYFHWAGADLFSVTSPGGSRRQMVIETNSCPSGNKSMPLIDEDFEAGGASHFVPFF
jgi:hypothetical protein